LNTGFFYGHTCNLFSRDILGLLFLLGTDLQLSIFQGQTYQKDFSGADLGHCVFPGTHLPLLFRGQTYQKDFQGTDLD